MTWCILKGGVEEGPVAPAADEGIDLPPSDQPVPLPSQGEPSLPSVEPSAKAGRRSYVVRHWRGELSLPVSCWINSLLLTAIYTQFKKSAWPVFLAEFPKPYSIFVISTWVFGGMITIWQLVGIWRSADHYLKQGKSKLWGDLAKVWVAAGLISSARMFALIGIPQMVEYSEIAMGHDPVGTYDLRVLNDATELDLTGFFAFGLGNDVARILEEHPTIRMIRLESQGGRISEARKVRQLIDSRQMTTYTSERCYSACMLPYVAGRERLITKEASLGFHQYSYDYPGMKGYDFKPEYDSRLEYEKDKQDWLSRGFSRDFVERAFSTPNSEMWEPTHRELFDARIVTGYLDGDNKPVDHVSVEKFGE